METSQLTQQDVLMNRDVLDGNGVGKPLSQLSPQVLNKFMSIIENRKKQSQQQQHENNNHKVDQLPQHHHAAIPKKKFIPLGANEQLDPYYCSSISIMKETSKEMKRNRKKQLDSVNPKEEKQKSKSKKQKRNPDFQTEQDPYDAENDENEDGENLDEDNIQLKLAFQEIKELREEIDFWKIQVSEKASIDTVADIQAEWKKYKENEFNKRYKEVRDSIPFTNEEKMEYEDEVKKTFLLSNSTTKEKVNAIFQLQQPIFSVVSSS